MLSVRFGTPVRIVDVKDFPYSRVSRYSLEAAGGAVPETVVVRALRPDPARSGLARLHNERAALAFLTAIGSTLAPRFIAGDSATGILITEDLGTHASLLDLLLGGDGAIAYQGLLAFARGLGTLHAQTVGRGSAYDDRRARLQPADPNAEHPGLPFSVIESWRQVRAAVVQLGLPDPRRLESDIEEIANILAAPGDCRALSSGDPSLVNCKVADGTVRFFDFEDAGFRHVLLDATVLRYPHPTGGPVWSLPTEVASAIEQAYREKVAHACPIVLDNASYEGGMAAASAAWTILRMVRLPRVQAGPDRDPWLLLPPAWSAPIPMRSRRRQLVAIIETCIDSAHRSGTLEAFAGWCVEVVRTLRARWPEAMDELPLYPAFRE